VDITVVGAGVIGLVTALVLEEQGHAVHIVAAESGDRTTSAVAGAVWFPYKAGPPDKVAAWAARTRAWLEAIDDRAAGVERVTCYEIASDDDTKPWWASAVEVSRVRAPVTGTPLAWRFIAPRIEPARFLPWLQARLHAPVEHRVVIDLAAEPGDVVVNCSGLGSRELAGDDLLLPLLGQIAIVDPAAADMTISVTDFYAIPRRDELVLGGCSRPWPPGAPAELDPELSARMVAQARSLGLDAGAIRNERVGLRPYRLEVRLERDGRIIHNYGHGGAGFTLCRGCADDVAALVTATVCL